MIYRNYISKKNIKLSYYNIFRRFVDDISKRYIVLINYDTLGIFILIYYCEEPEGTELLNYPCVCVY